MDEKKEHGAKALAHEYARYDQVQKPDYHLAEQTEGEETFDEDFEIKTCDLARFLHGNAEDKRRFAAELGDAMEEIGFAILVGHGVDPALHERAAEWVEPFFVGASLEAKMRYRAARHGSVSQGYFPIEETSDIHPDQVQGWVFCRRAFDLDGKPSYRAEDFWPDTSFEPRFRQLVTAELPLIPVLMQVILTHLGCDPHLYDAKLRDGNFGLRLNYYPPAGPDVAARSAGRLLGHEDIDLFTLLPAPAVEGLQVLTREGKWVRLEAPPGSIVLNTGDYMQRLSNDILPSTTHRVSPPRDPRLASQPRVSLPLAAYLWEDELLEVLPSLGPPKYEPVRAITFHTRTTAKFYGDDYAVESEA